MLETQHSTGYFKKVRVDLEIAGKERHTISHVKKQKSSLNRPKRSNDDDWKALEYETELKHYDYWLQEHDIAHIARIKYEYDEGYKKVDKEDAYDKTNSKVVFVICGLNTLAKQLEQFKKYVEKRSETRPLTAIINLGGVHWVALVVVHQNNQYFAHYFDSNRDFSTRCGYYNDIKKTLQDKHRISVIDFSAKQQEDNYNCGIFALDNSNIISKMLVGGDSPVAIQTKFKDKLTAKQLEEKRKDFSEKLLNDPRRISFVIVNFAIVNNINTSLDPDIDINNLDEESLKSSLDLKGLLDRAIQKKYLRIATFALSKGAGTNNLSDNDKKKLLDYIKEHNLGVIQQNQNIINSLSIVQQENQQPLHSNRQPVSNGNDFSDYDDNQSYAKLNEGMMEAIRGGGSEEEKLKKIGVFLSDGADVNFKDANRENNTPLHAAVRKGEPKIVKLLTEKGAKVVKNDSGHTPLDIAKRSSTPNGQEIVNILEGYLKGFSRVSVQQASVEQLFFISIPESNENAQSQPTPTATNRIVKWSGWYTEEQVKTNPKLLFLFGDNDEAKYRTDHSNPGGEGQASVIRPTGKGKLPYDRIPEHGGLNGNGIGITTVFRGRYTPNLNEFKVLMDKEFEPIETWVEKGGSVVVPCNSKGEHNLGTGIADLKDKIPGAIEYIQSKVDELVRLGQQTIQDPQSKNLDTLKQELHKTLLAERGSYKLHVGLEGYIREFDQQPQRKKAKIVSELEDSMPKLSAEQGSITNDRDNMESDSEKQTRKRPSTDNQLENRDLKKPKISEPTWKSNPTHSASELKRSLHGDNYQLGLLILFAWEHKKDAAFRLGTEVADAGKFDDVVLRYIDDEGKIKYRFLQAKHKQHLTEGSDIPFKDFFHIDREKDKKDFSLTKYFFSYLKDIETFKDGYIEDFTLCTNRDFEQSVKNEYLEEITTKDKVLDLGGKRYKFAQSKRSEVIKKLSEVFNKNTRSGASNKHKDETIGEFLDKLVFAVGQPSGPDLKNKIKEKVGDQFNLINSIVYDSFATYMSEWMEHREEGEGGKGPGVAHFLEHEDLKVFLEIARQEISRLVLIGPTSLRRLEIKESSVTFESEGATIKELEVFLTSNDGRQIFNLVTQKTLLGAIKVDNVLNNIDSYKKKDSHIFVQLSTLNLLEKGSKDAFKPEDAFKSEKNNLLVIECDPISEDIQELYGKFSRIVQNDSNKKVILITQEGNDLANKFKQGFSQSNKYEEKHDDKNGFENLNSESKQKLLDKKIILHGKNKLLKEVADNESLEKIIGPDELVELITSDKIEIGKAYEFSYVPNSEMNRKYKSNEVDEEMLSKAGDEDIFILGVTKIPNKSLDSLQKDLRGKHSNKGIFVHTLADAESKFGDSVSTNKKGNVYWLKGDFQELKNSENAKLEFKGSYGDLNTLRKHVIVDKEDGNLQIDDLGKVFIIHGEAGIGKTTLFKELYYVHSKSSWVIDIDLSDAASGSWSDKNFGGDNNANINSFIEVLKELKKLNSESRLEESLFRSAFEDKGVELRIFFDSFEKIGGDDREAVLSLLKTLKGHAGVKKLAVAVRSYDKHKIEDALSEFAYELPKLKDPAQKKMLKHFLKDKDEKDIDELTGKCKEEGIDISLPIIIELVSSNLDEEILHTAFGGTSVNLCHGISSDLLERFAEQSGLTYALSKKLQENLLNLAISQVFSNAPINYSKNLINFAQEHAGIGGIFESNRDTDSPVLRSVFAESQVKMDSKIQGIIERNKKGEFNVDNIDKAGDIIKKNYYTDIAKPIREYVDQESSKDNPILIHILDARAGRLSLLNLTKELIKLRKESGYYQSLKKGLFLAGDYCNGDLVEIIIKEILSQGLKEFDEKYKVLDKMDRKKKEKKKDKFMKELYGKYGSIRKFDSTFFSSKDEYYLYLYKRIEKIRKTSEDNHKFRNDLLYFARLGNVYAINVAFSTMNWAYYYSNEGSPAIGITPKNLNQKDEKGYLIDEDKELIVDVVKNIEQKDNLLSFSVEKKLDYLSLALIETESSTKEIENDKGGKILYSTIYDKSVIVRNELARHYRSSILNERGSDGKAFVHRLVEGYYSATKLRHYIKYVNHYHKIRVDVLDDSGMNIVAIAFYANKLVNLKTIMDQFPKETKELFTSNQKALEEAKGDSSKLKSLAFQQIAILYISVFLMDKKVTSKWLHEIQKISESIITNGMLNSYAFALLRSRLGDYKNALPFFQPVLEERESILEPDHLDTLSTQQELAVVYGKLGNYEEALKLLQPVLEERESILGSDHPDVLSTEHELAVIWGKKGDYKGALKLLQGVLEKRLKVLEPDHLDTLSTQQELAVVYGKLGNYDEALKLLREVLEKRKNVLELDHPDILSTQQELAVVYSKLRNYDEALRLLREVLEKRDNVLVDEDDIDILSTEHELAVVRSLRGYYDTAIDSFEDVLERRELTLGFDHLDTLSTKHELAVAYSKRGDYKYALTLLQKVQEERESILEPDHLDTLSTQQELAVVYGKLGNYDEALKLLREVLEKRESILGSDHPDTLSTKLEIGILLRHKGEYSDALSEFRDVVEKRKRYLGTEEDYLDDPMLLSIEYEVVMAHLFLEDYSIALEKLQEIITQEEESLVENFLQFIREKGQLNELKNKLEELSEGDRSISKKASNLLDLIQRRFESYNRVGCAQRKKRQTSIPCVDSRDEENITKEEEEQLKNLESEINNEVLSRYKEIKGGATYDVNKSDLLSNALQSLRRSEELLSISKKIEVFIELQEKAYYNALIDIGALIHDHKNHVHGDHLSALESRVQGNQLFSVAHDLYYLLKSEDNVDQDKLYSDQVKSKIRFYVEGKNRLDDIYSEFNIIDIKGYFSDSDVKDFYTEAEAYDKEVITIHSTQVFANEVEVYVKVKDSNGNHQKMVIGNVASIQNTEDYILDEETSEIKLRIDDDKKYTITEELEEGHFKHYFNIPGGYKVKVGNVISSFTEDTKRAIHSRLRGLELLASKKYVEEISNAETTDQDYNNVLGEIKQSLLQKGVIEGTFNQIKDHLDSLGVDLAKHISDIRKDLEGHGIELNHGKFDLAKRNVANGGKLLSLMAIYDLLDSISDVPTLGRHDNDALKQIFGINGMLDAMDDVRESLSASYTRSDGKVIPKIPRDSAMGKVISKIPDHIRKTFVKIINNPVVQGITFVTIAYQFGYSINEIAKGNHHPLNYYWTASSGIKLGSMSIGASSAMIGRSAIIRNLRWLPFASKVSLVADFGVVIYTAIDERVKYVETIAQKLPLKFGDKVELFFAKVNLWENIEKKYEDTMEVKDYLRRGLIEFLGNTNMAGVVVDAPTIIEKYSEMIVKENSTDVHSDSGANYGTGTIPRLPNCQLEKRVDNISFYKMVDMTPKDLSLLNISKTLLMEFWQDKEEFYIEDMKHIPYLTKHEYEKLGLRIVGAPLKYQSQEPQCSNIITKKHDRKKCNVGKVYRTCQRNFTSSGEPFIFANSTNLSGTILYISEHKALTAAANYPAEMHVPSYLPYDRHEIDYTGSKHRTVFVVNNPSYGSLTGESRKENTLVIHTSNFKVIADLQDDPDFNDYIRKREGSVSFIIDHDSCTGIFVDYDKQHPLFPECIKGILLLNNVYNYVSNSSSEHRVITHCETRSINAKNAEVRQGGKDCHDQDYEIRVVNEGNLHYRGLKQTIFTVGESSDGAKILRDARNKERIKSNTDTILANVADIKQLKIREEQEGGYSLSLLDKNTQSVVSSVKVDSFENLVIQAERPGVIERVVIHSKFLNSVIKDAKLQILSKRMDVDEKIIQDSKSTSHAVIQVNIQDRGFSAYETAKNIANNNNLGIPISQIEVTKNYTLVSNEKVIIGSIYSEQIMIDFGYSNSNVANSNGEGYDYKCSYYQNIIVEGGNTYIIKLPEFNHTLEHGILKSSMFKLHLEIRGEAEHIFYKIVDLGEFGAIDVNDINMIKGKRKYFTRSDFNDCYNYRISDLTEDSLEIKNVIVSNDEGIQWSLSIGLVDYFKSPKYQFVALRINDKFYTIDNKDLKLEHTGKNPNFLKLYQPDHGDHDRHHSSPAIDSSNQPEIAARQEDSLQNDEIDYNKGGATSGASKPSSGHHRSPIEGVASEEYSENIASSATRVSSPINNVFNWAKNSIEGVSQVTTNAYLAIKGVIVELFGSVNRLISDRISVVEEMAAVNEKVIGASEGVVKCKLKSRKDIPNSTSSTPFNNTDQKQTDNGFYDFIEAIPKMGDYFVSHFNSDTIMLLDLFIRKITGQKYISTAEQPISQLEAQSYALNITDSFKKALEQQAELKDGIKMHRLDIDFAELEEEITKRVMGDRLYEIPEILRSYAEKACPGREAGCPGRLRQKKFDEFNNRLDVVINELMTQIIYNRNVIPNRNRKIREKLKSAASQKARTAENVGFSKYVKGAHINSKKTELKDRGISNKDDNLVQIDVPGDDGSCLFWSVALAYLIPSYGDSGEFCNRCKLLFGEESSKDWEKLRKLILSRGFCEDLCVQKSISYGKNTLKSFINKFRGKVANYISSDQNLKGSVNIHNICNLFENQPTQERIIYEKLKGNGKLRFEGKNLKEISDQFYKAKKNGNISEAEENEVNDAISEAYVECVRDGLFWGSELEIEAMTKMLPAASIYVSRKNSRTLHSTKEYNTKIELFHVGNSHYKFGLKQDTVQSIAQTLGESTNSSPKQSGTSNSSTGKENILPHGRPKITEKHSPSPWPQSYLSNISVQGGLFTHARDQGRALIS